MNSNKFILNFQKKVILELNLFFFNFIFNFWKSCKIAIIFEKKKQIRKNIYKTKIK